MNKQDVISFFDRLAPQWDADMIRHDDVIATILDNAGVSQGVDVLDVACGTGVLFPDYLSRDVGSLTAVDISGRGGCHYALEIPTQKVGDFDTELVQEFFIAFANNAGLTLHLRQLCGTNSHHIIEGTFKSVARSLKKAVAIDKAFANEVPSTKGLL